MAVSPRDDDALEPDERVGSGVTAFAPASYDGAELAPGQMLGGRYRVLAELGRGGMGIVYRVDDGEAGEEVAAKVLRADLAGSEEAVGRFRQEVRVARRLRHRAIVPVFDVGTHGRSLYYTMALLQGQSLRAAIDAGVVDGMSLRQRIDLLGQVMDAIGYAHTEGVIHRDITPGNVLVDLTQSHGARVHVVDFGIARLIGEAAQHTRANQRLGSMYYMAPEQARGGDVDHRADVYALGALTYEILTGNPPLPMAPPPSAVVPGLPKHIDEAVRRSMAADPKDRWQSVEAFRAALMRAPEQPKVAPAAGPTQAPAKAAATAPAAGPTQAPVKSAAMAPAPEPTQAPVRAAATAPETPTTHPEVARAGKASKPRGSWVSTAITAMVAAGLVIGGYFVYERYAGAPDRDPAGSAKPSPKKQRKGKVPAAEDKLELCKRAQGNMRRVMSQSLDDLPPDLRAKTEADIDAALGESFLDECQRQPEADIRCVAEADDVEAMGACDSTEKKK